MYLRKWPAQRFEQRHNRLCYEKHIEKTERQKLVLDEKLGNSVKTLHPFEKMFELAMGFLSNPCKIWESDRLEDERTVLKLTFSERLAYCRKTEFQTPKPPYHSTRWEENTCNFVIWRT